MLQPRLRRQRRDLRRRRCASRRASGASRSAPAGRSARPTASASRSRCCSSLSSRRTPDACTTITDTECATTSCSSRAIRARSSAAACSATSRSSRSCSMRRPKRRLIRPRCVSTARDRSAVCTRCASSAEPNPRSSSRTTRTCSRSALGPATLARLGAGVPQPRPPLSSAGMDELPDLRAAEGDRRDGRRRVGPRARRAVRALALLVRRAGRRRRVLKVAWAGDDESLHEAESLALWDGDGAVRLLRSDPSRARCSRSARCRATISRSCRRSRRSRSRSTSRARLWRPAGEPFRWIGDHVPGWIDRGEREGMRGASWCRSRASCSTSLEVGRSTADPRRLPPPQHPAPRRPLRRDRQQGDARRPRVRRAVVPLEPALVPDDRPRAHGAADRGVRRRRARRLQDPRLDRDPRPPTSGATPRGSGARSGLCVAPSAARRISTLPPWPARQGARRRPRSSGTRRSTSRRRSSSSTRSSSRTSPTSSRPASATPSARVILMLPGRDGRRHRRARSRPTASSTRRCSGRRRAASATTRPSTSASARRSRCG